MSRVRAPHLALAVAALLLVGLAAPGTPPARATPDRVSALGGSWFAVGYNYPWHRYNYDFGDDAGENIHGQYAALDAQLADLQASGTHVTRWYVFNDGERYPHFDGMLALASAHNVYVIPVLWDSPVAKRGRNHAAVITDAGVRQSYLDN